MITLVTNESFITLFFARERDCEALGKQITKSTARSVARRKGNKYFMKKSVMR